ncbi:MAG: TolC family protein [Ignavibacteriaceae bacterium]
MRILVIFILLFISGCATFNDKEIKPEKTAAEFQERNLTNAGLKDFIAKALSKNLPTWSIKNWDIETLTLTAYYYNPKIDVAIAGWEKEKGSIITANEIPNPKLNLLPDYISNPTQNLSPWKVGISLEELLLTAGKIKYKSAKAKYLAESAMLNLANEEWNFRYNIKLSLIKLYEAVQEKKLIVEQLNIFQNLLSYLKNKAAEGELSLKEYLADEINYRGLKIRSIEADLKENKELQRLADELGVPVNALDKINFSFDFINVLPPKEEIKFNELKKQALTGRADILKALSDYSASQEELKYQIAKQYPDIALGPGYKWDQGQNTWSLGISINLPVFNQNEGPIAEVKALRSKKAAGFLSVQDKIINEVDASFSRYILSLNKLRSIDSLVSNKKQQVSYFYDMNKIGEIDNPHLLKIRIDLLSSKLMELKNLIDAQLAFSELENALQAGFKPNYEILNRNMGSKGN